MPCIISHTISTSLVITAGVDRAESAIEEDHIHSIEGIQCERLRFSQLIHEVAGVVRLTPGVSLCDRVARLPLQAQPPNHVRQLLVGRLQLHDVLEVARAHPAYRLLRNTVELQSPAAQSVSRKAAVSVVTRGREDICSPINGRYRFKLREVIYFPNQVDNLRMDPLA